MVEFCPVCKSLLLVKKEGDKTIGYCSCGFKRLSGIEISSSETGKDKIKEAGIAQDDDSKGFVHKCSKCGSTSSEVTELGEILNNENSVCLYKCKKCGHVERETQ